MEVLKMELLPHAPPSPTRRLDILFYSAPSSPRSSVAPEPTPPDSDDFEFDFSGQLDQPALSAADELFHAGKILPLLPTPPATLPNSPKRKPTLEFQNAARPADSTHRGRARDPNPKPRKGISRSLSPLRVSEFALQQQQQQQQSSNSSSSRGCRKWKLKDLLLFRSASEGSRPKAKLKYSVNDSKRFSGGHAKTPSFRSPHELHYAANRAVAEDLKKKTSLPYKYGFLGCLGFNLSPSSSASGFQEFSRGFGYYSTR